MAVKNTKLFHNPVSLSETREIDNDGKNYFFRVSPRRNRPYQMLSQICLIRIFTGGRQRTGESKVNRRFQRYESVTAKGV